MASQYEVCALLPRLSSKLGHIFHYHIAVQSALTSIGWGYRAYIPQKAAIAPLPSGWYPSLANDISESFRSVWQKLTIFFTNIFPFRQILKDIEHKRDAIVFIEHFEWQHLASLVFALCFFKPQFHFWILYRYELEGRRLKIGFFRFFLSFMRRKLGKERVKCLTDSELLSEVLGKDLKSPVRVIPIPHTEEDKRAKETKDGQLQFWWPGGLIREDKGLSTILRLLALVKDQKNIQLVVAEKAREVVGEHPCIHFVATSLPREEYVGWMQRADLILLPYSRRDYSRRTSGIFVEAIAAGAIPITTQGTWMAYELGKFALTELTFDWEEERLLEQLCEIVSDQAVKDKLAVMRRHYQEFHCSKGLATSLQQLIHS